MRLPHSSNYQINPICKFFAGWEVLFERFMPGMNPEIDPMPRHNTINNIVYYQQHVPATGNTREFSVEYLCRLLAPNAYRNTMQATNPFMNINIYYIDGLQARSPASGRIVNSAILTDAGKNQLIECRQQANWQELKNSFEALLEADLEVYDRTNDTDGLVADSFEINHNNGLLADEFQNNAINPVIGGAPFNMGTFIQDFVNRIHNDPYQPIYRGRRIGTSIVGWDSRLTNYFWPNPTQTLGATFAVLNPLIVNATPFIYYIQGVGPRPLDADLIDWANSIFNWGGVPQQPHTVNFKNIVDVLNTVITGTNVHGAIMNSGWTKVASFASEVLPENQHLVIFDSRVAHSLVTRFETMLVKMGYPVHSLPPGLQNIGYVRGRGGSRVGYKYSPRWRNAYGSWDAVFKASEIIRLIRDDLNTRLDASGNLKFPCPVHGGWTVRLVEMVLFMDGY